jgi:hypothetical protein
MRVRIAAGLAAAALAILGVPAATAAPAPLTPQPGDAIAVGGRGGTCTLGFILAGSDGATYAATAGHCVLDTSLPGDQRRTYPRGTGPDVSLTGNADGSTTSRGTIGKVVYAEFARTEADDDWYDFALIRINGNVRPDPRVRGLDRPRYVDNSTADWPALLSFYGQGDAFGQVQPARRLVANTMHNPRHVYANGPAFFGDSGAPVLSSDGGAVGIVVGAGGTSVGIGIGSVELGHDEALNIICRLKPLLAHATSFLRVRLTIPR